jgi:hypothetical protein
MMSPTLSLLASAFGSVRESKGTPEGDSDAVAIGFQDGALQLFGLGDDEIHMFADQLNSPHQILSRIAHFGRFVTGAIKEFEELINDGTTKERDLQNFFETHPDFLIRDEYKRAHPHLMLSPLDRESLIPDFVLEPHDQSSFCDLLELKLPTHKVATYMKNRSDFSSTVHRAIAQLRQYQDHFEEAANRKAFTKRYGLNLYRPRMMLIIGRKQDIDHRISAIEYRRMEMNSPQLIIRTYDDLLRRVRSRNR